MVASDLDSSRGKTNDPVRSTEQDFRRMVKNSSVASILRVETKRGGDGEKTADVSSEIR